MSALSAISSMPEGLRPSGVAADPARNGDILHAICHLFWAAHGRGERNATEAAFVEAGGIETVCRILLLKENDLMKLQVFGCSVLQEVLHRHSGSLSWYRRDDGGSTAAAQAATASAFAAAVAKHRPVVERFMAAGALSVAVSALHTHGAFPGVRGSEAIADSTCRLIKLLCDKLHSGTEEDPVRVSVSAFAGAIEAGALRAAAAALWAHVRAAAREGAPTIVEGEAEAAAATQSITLIGVCTTPGDSGQVWGSSDEERCAAAGRRSSCAVSSCCVAA